MKYADAQRLIAAGHAELPDAPREDMPVVTHAEPAAVTQKKKKKR